MYAAARDLIPDFRVSLLLLCVCIRRVYPKRENEIRFAVRFSPGLTRVVSLSAVYLCASVWLEA